MSASRIAPPAAALVLYAALIAGLDALAVYLGAGEEPTTAPLLRVGLWVFVTWVGLGLGTLLILLLVLRPLRALWLRARGDRGGDRGARLWPWHPKTALRRRALVTASLTLLAATTLHALGAGQLLLAGRSVEARQLAVLVAALALFPGLVWALPRAEEGAQRLVRVLARSLGAKAFTLVALVGVVLPASLLALSLASSHGEFLEQLARQQPLRELLAWGGLGAILLALLRAPLSASQRPVRSRATRLQLGVALVGVLGALGATAWLMAVPPSQPSELARSRVATMSALQQGTWFSGALMRRAHASLLPPPVVRAEGVRACRPEEGLALPGTLGDAAEGAPDIIFVTVDGVRFDHTSIDPSSRHPNTPRLRARLADAAVFMRAYTPAPSTRAAFRSIFTGLLPGQVEAPADPRFPWGLTLLPEQPTMAEYLGRAGYETVALLSKPKAFPRETHALRGFAEIDDAATEYHLEHRYSAQLKVSRIIGRLSEPPREGQAPRFVWTHLIEPHYPYTRGPMTAPAPASVAATRPGARHEPRHNLAVRYIDEQLDRLLEFASAPERRERTLVVITADHGEAFGEHHNARHGATVYEEEIHVPLLVFGAGIRPGARQTPVSLVSLLPTLLDFAGLSPASGLCGQSWAPGLRNGDEPRAEPIYVAALPDETTRYYQVAFLEGRHKLWLDVAMGSAKRFDVLADPGERSPSMVPEEIDAALGELNRFLAERGLPSVR